jgi:putative two-component system response regulator
VFQRFPRQLTVDFPKTSSTRTVVRALLRVVELKSPATRQHCVRVTRHALALADVLGLPRADRMVLRYGALLHDVGKLYIPDSILNKPGPLTSEEFEYMKVHPRLGAHLVESWNCLRAFVPMIRWHHERLDGTGYPDGLRGDDIPLLARIISVCDVYDGVSSLRPYHPARDREQTAVILRQEARANRLDAQLVELFLELRNCLA